MSANDAAFTFSRWALDIPFRVSFRHASAARAATAAVWVEAREENGHRGIGEGCPREYVTGESVAGALRFIDRQCDGLSRTISDVGSLRAWVNEHRALIDANPAAWCAIELALLDLFARRAGRSVESSLGLRPLIGPFVYTAVLGATGAEEFAATLARYQKFGLCDYKIKLSGNAADDCQNLAILRAAGIAPVRVRADANNLWNDLTAAQAYLQALDFPFFALEEPLRAGRYAELAALAQALDTRIVLDESLARIEQLDELAGARERWIVNLRVSKMGGLLRSLHLADRCRERGIALIVGAQVGETSLLTRAALTVASAARDSVIAQEGAFGTLLLESDAVTPTLMFGPKGALDVAPLRLDRAPGFGLEPLPELAPRFLRSDAKTVKAHGG